MKVANGIFAHRRSKTTFKTRAVSKIESALKGADFVFISVLPGPLRMFINDLEIPAKYGVMQSVGDTTGPGGLSRAMRIVPTYVRFAEQIMTHCPDAWVINYTNPMTLCTSALYAAAPQIKAFGCCHEVFGTQAALAARVHEFLKVPQPHRREIKLEISGVNHFTFATEAHWNGVDLFPLVEKWMAQKGRFADQTKWSQEKKAKGNWFGSQWLIATDMYRRFGALGAAGDRHLAEFVPWYLSSEDVLHRWGVLLTPPSYRLGVYQPRSKKPDLVPRPSDEEGVKQMTALLGLADLDTNVNVPNRGQCPDLPVGAMVESYAAFRRNKLSPISTKPLPKGAAAQVRRVIDQQQLILEASMNKDIDMAFQGLLSDALIRMPTDRAWQMFGELNRANRAMLRGWKI